MRAWVSLRGLLLARRARASSSSVVAGVFGFSLSFAPCRPPVRQMELFEAKKREVEAWIRRQPPQVEVAAATASGAAQGALIGGMMATFSAMEPPAGAAGALAPPKARPSAAAWRLAADAFRYSRRGWWEDRPCLRATSR